MELKFCAVGNSIGLRIPADIRSQLGGVKKGDIADLRINDGVIEIHLVKDENDLTLADMLKGCPASALERTEEDRSWLGMTDIGGETIG